MARMSRSVRIRTLSQLAVVSGACLDEKKKNSSSSGATWFVGASYGGTDGQMPRFLKAGIWENGYDDKLLDMVRAMQPGEQIAIKAAYTRHNRPPPNPRQ